MVFIGKKGQKCKRLCPFAYTHSNAGVGRGEIARQATVFYAACMRLFN
jgi:hypothetical protein